MQAEGKPACQKMVISVDVQTDANMCGMSENQDIEHELQVKNICERDLIDCEIKDTGVNTSFTNEKEMQDEETVTEDIFQKRVNIKEV